MTISKLIAGSTVFFVSVVLLTSQVSAQSSESPASCSIQNLSVLPYPNPTLWNTTGQFIVKNTAAYATTFNWVLDAWTQDSLDQSGQVTLQPGETKVFGLGNICSKWQLDLGCGNRSDETGFVVESHVSACVQTTPTPTPTPVATPDPTSTPTPVTGRGKESSMALTPPSCSNNMDASIVLMLDGNPVKDVNVKFTYENESKYAKTEANGRAGVEFGYKAATDVVIDPEDGYPSQRQKAIATQCATTGMVQGISTEMKQGQILGMADTGVIDDMIANVIGAFGTLSTVIGTFMYGKSRFKSKAKRA